MFHNIFFFRKPFVLWDTVNIHSEEPQATDGNTAHAHCTLDNWGHNYTHRICNAFALFHCNNDWNNALQCYVIRTLPVFFNLLRFSLKWNKNKHHVTGRRTHSKGNTSLCLLLVKGTDCFLCDESTETEQTLRTESRNRADLRSRSLREENK